MTYKIAMPDLDKLVDDFLAEHGDHPNAHWWAEHKLHEWRKAYADPGYRASFYDPDPAREMSLLKRILEIILESDDSDHGKKKTGKKKKKA